MCQSSYIRPGRWDSLVLGIRIPQPLAMASIRAPRVEFLKPSHYDLTALWNSSSDQDQQLFPPLWVFIAFNPFLLQLSFLSTSTIPLVPAWPLSNCWATSTAGRQLNLADFEAQPADKQALFFSCQVASCLVTLIVQAWRLSTLISSAGFFVFTSPASTAEGRQDKTTQEKQVCIGPSVVTAEKTAQDLLRKPEEYLDQSQHIFHSTVPLATATAVPLVGHQKLFPFGLARERWKCLQSLLELCKAFDSKKLSTHCLEQS